MEPLPTTPFPKIAIYRMDVEELATWVKDFSNSRQWNEADIYAEFCRRKGIDGQKIVKLNNKDLREDLGISKLGHRLELLRTIKALCSHPRARCVEQMERWHQTVSSYSDSEWSVTPLDNLPKSAPEPEPDSSSARKLRGKVPLGSYWSDSESLKPTACVESETIWSTASDVTEGKKFLIKKKIK